VNGGVFDSTNFDSAFATSNFTTSMNVFDSLGARHTLNFFFQDGGKRVGLLGGRRCRRGGRHGR